MQTDYALEIQVKCIICKNCKALIFMSSHAVINVITSIKCSDFKVRITNDNASYTTSNINIFRCIIINECVPYIDIHPLGCYFCRIWMAEFLIQCMGTVSEEVTGYEFIKSFNYFNCDKFIYCKRYVLNCINFFEK